MLPTDTLPRVAYFSMEIAVDPAIPGYSGGLGVLAGDTIRSAADLGVPMVGMTLLYKNGYFTQVLDAEGGQSEHGVRWTPGDRLQPVAPRVWVTVEGRRVWVRAWRALVSGVSGAVVPVYMLDTDVPENSDEDRAITDALYAGDQRHRLSQEIVLGVGGVRMLRALGNYSLRRFHMNEGHAALLTLELLREKADALRAGGGDVAVREAVRQQCVFTTHTPVAAGHDSFPADLAARVLGRAAWFERDDLFLHDNHLHMTRLALSMSRYVNAVARRHADVSRRLFPGSRIDSVTNGVHARTWVGSGIGAMLERAAPGWDRDNSLLRAALSVRDDDLFAAHRLQKDALIKLVNTRYAPGAELPGGGTVPGVPNGSLDGARFTIGFARRATGYKRMDLLLSDQDRLAALAQRFGPIQILFAGKAHPHDHAGKDLIRNVLSAAAALAERRVHVRFLPNYEVELCRAMVQGVDLWVNTPLPPLEASGTSGMKAAMNAVPQLSVIDGWWVEGWVEGVTGWAIGDDDFVAGRTNYDELRGLHARAMYDALERTILPLWMNDRPGWARVMKGALGVNGAFFNTHRMVEQYAARAYAD